MTGVTPETAALSDAFQDWAKANGYDNEHERNFGHWHLARAFAAGAQHAQTSQPAPGTCPASSTVTAGGEPHTDTCDRPEGHTGDHRCPGCGASWVMLSEHLLRKERPAVGTAWRLLDQARAENFRMRGAISDLLDSTGLDDAERARWLEMAGLPPESDDDEDAQ